MEKSFLPKIAFNALKGAEFSYNEKGSFPNEILETLHSYFGKSFIQAAELLEKCKIIRYSTPDRLRRIYKVSTSQEDYSVFDEINFCHCEFFKTEVLESRSSLSCRHVLAVRMGKIMGKYKEEIINEGLYEEFLNQQLNFLDVDTQDIVLG